MKNSKTVITLSSIAIVLAMIIIGVGASYAYFKINAVMNVPNNGNEAIVTTNYLDFDFETSEYLNNDNMLLIKPTDVAAKSEKIKFSITKKAGITYKIKYNIYMTDFIITDNLKSQDFKWDLLENGTSIYSGNFKNSTSGTEFLFTSTPILLTNNSANYELRVWLEETSSDQSGLYRGSFSGKLRVEAMSVSEN